MAEIETSDVLAALAPGVQWVTRNAIVRAAIEERLPANQVFSTTAVADYVLIGIPPERRTKPMVGALFRTLQNLATHEMSAWATRGPAERGHGGRMIQRWTWRRPEICFNCGRPMPSV